MADTFYDLERIFELMARLDWSGDQLHDYRTARLRDLLRHAVDHSSWYRKSLDGLNPDTAELTDLATLPVLTKQDLMNNWDNIVTVPGMTLTDCRRHFDALPEAPVLNDFLLDGRAINSTGGTSGLQAIVLRDQKEWIETFFAMIRWSLRAMIESGDQSSAIPVVAGIAGDCSRHLGTAMSLALGSELVPISLPLQEQCTRLEAMAPQVLAGYSSGVARVAKAAIAGKLTINPESISCTSECLTDEFRKLLGKAWPDARIINSYGTTECGMIATSSGKDETLYVNEDFFVVEGINEDRALTPKGKTSHCVAVTCLEARALPLIRYELQDRIAFSTEPSPEGLPQARIQSIGGRTSDWLKWGTKEVHPYAFTAPLTDDPAVDIYQVCQTTGGADIKIVPSGIADLDEERLTGEIKKGLCEAGAPSNLTITCVDDIPRVGDGQKHRTMIPLD